MGSETRYLMLMITSDGLALLNCRIKKHGSGIPPIVVLPDPSFIIALPTGLTGLFVGTSSSVVPQFTSRYHHPPSDGQALPNFHIFTFSHYRITTLPHSHITMSPSLHQLRHEYEKQITSLKQNIMLPNFLVLLATAFIPFIVAMGYYHSSVFGGDNWQKIAGLTDEQHAKPVKTSKLLLSLVLNFFLAFGLYNVCVHQAGLFGMIGANTDLLTSGVGKAFFDEYGMNHLSFGHGVLHGLAPGTLTFALPIVGYVVIFEKKSRAYFFVTLGYWAICMALMGGVISQWGWVLP